VGERKKEGGGEVEGKKSGRKIGGREEVYGSQGKVRRVCRW